MSVKPDLSCFSGFFAKSLEDRRSVLFNFLEKNGVHVGAEGTEQAEQLALFNSTLDGALPAEVGNKMVENFVGMLQLPVGICPYLYVNNKHYVVPMATEEPSVIAAVSSICKLVFDKGVDMDLGVIGGTEKVSVNGGFVGIASDNVMTTQIQLVFEGQDNALVDTACEQACEALRACTGEIVSKCNEHCASMVARGGGTKAVRVDVVRNKAYELSMDNAMDMYLEEMGASGAKSRITSHVAPYQSEQSYVVVYISVNVCDSMGANLLNTIAEGVSAFLLDIAQSAVKDISTHVKPGIRILTNLCLDRWVKCGCRIPFSALGWKSTSGVDVGKQMYAAWRFARDDPLRAATHNKGVMNGISAVALATGQDTRAIEAAVHAYAGSAGRYQPITKYQLTDDALEVTIEIPLALGTRGGSINTHPLFRLAMTQLQYPTAQELSIVFGCVGLAQNMAAVRA